MNVKSKTGHISSSYHKRREQTAFTVKTYEVDVPEIYQKDNIIEESNKDCKDNIFTFESIVVNML